MKSFEQYFADFARHMPDEYLQYGYDTGKPNGMAASLESLEFFRSQVDEDGVILDCGAGASSWMLRQWFPNVVTLESKRMEDYLYAVQGLLRRAGIPCDRFRCDIEDAPPADYAFVDYPYKINCADIALTKKGVKAIYIDDCDTRPECGVNRAGAYALAKREGWMIRDCPEAIDQYGRWGVLLEKR